MRVEVLVKSARLQENMTLSSLSRKSGVSISHLSDIEHNKKVPSLLVMVLIAKALDVPITDLYKVKW